MSDNGKNEGDYDENRDVAVDYEDGNVDASYESRPDGENEGQDETKKGEIPEGCVPNVLFVSRFGRGTTVRDVEELMKPFGPTTDITVRDTIAFVDFVNNEDAAKAKAACHYHPGLGSDSLIVDFKKDKGARGPRPPPRSRPFDGPFRGDGRGPPPRDRSRSRERDRDHRDYHHNGPPPPPLHHRPEPYDRHDGGSRDRYPSGPPPAYDRYPPPFDEPPRRPPLRVPYDDRRIGGGNGYPPPEPGGYPIRGPPPMGRDYPHREPLPPIPRYDSRNGPLHPVPPFPSYADSDRGGGRGGPPPPGPGYIHRGGPRDRDEPPYRGGGPPPPLAGYRSGGNGNGDRWNPGNAPVPRYGAPPPIGNDYYPEERYLKKPKY